MNSKIHDGSSRSEAREQRFQTIQYDSIRFKTQGRRFQLRFDAVQYDSRPKAGDSNYNSIQFNTIQEPRSDVPHVPIQSTTSIPSDTNDIHNPLQTGLVGDWKIDKKPSDSQALGLTSRGRFSVIPGTPLTTYTNVL